MGWALGPGSPSPAKLARASYLYVRKHDTRCLRPDATRPIPPLSTRQTYLKEELPRVGTGQQSGFAKKRSSSAIIFAPTTSILPDAKAPTASAASPLGSRPPWGTRVTQRCKRKPNGGDMRDLRLDREGDANSSGCPSSRGGTASASERVSRGVLLLAVIKARGRGLRKSTHEPDRSRARSRCLY